MGQSGAQRQKAWYDRQKRRKQQAAMIGDLLAHAVKDASVQLEGGGLRVTVDYDAALFAEVKAKCEEAGVDVDQLVDSHIKWAVFHPTEQEQGVTVSASA